MLTFCLWRVASAPPALKQSSHFKKESAGNIKKSAGNFDFRKLTQSQITCELQLVKYASDIHWVSQQNQCLSARIKQQAFVYSFVKFKSRCFKMLRVLNLNQLYHKLQDFRAWSLTGKGAVT